MAFVNGVCTLPYKRCVPVTASDTVVISTGPTDAICFVTTGTATVLDSSGNTVTFTAIPAGVVIPAQIVRVNATGLTAVLAALYNV